jgi:hypothetical protein
VLAYRFEYEGRAVVFATDPSHDDGAVDAIERSARAMWPGTVAAREGLELHLAGGGVMSGRAA